MQCETHGIAAGPDGRCALCRREASGRGASVAPSRRPVLLLSVLGLGLATVAVVLARPLFAPSNTLVLTPQLASATPTPVAEPEPEPEPEAAETEVKPEEPVAAESPPTAAEAPATPEPADSALALAPSASASAAGATPSPSASVAKPTQAALTNAVRATPIVMFSTDWCPVCKTARAFLAANDLSYTERDIDHDDRARDELKRRTGKSSIPTLEVDGKLLTPGFSEQAIMAAVAQSAQRRLGVDKIEIRSP